MDTKKLTLFPKTDKKENETPKDNSGLKVKTNIKAGPVEAVEVCG